LEFRILGPLEAVEDGHSLRLGGVRQRALLAFLLLHPNETVSSEKLIDELWPGASPVGAGNAVHAAISRLRGLLPPDSDGGPIETRQSGYTIALGPDQLDWYLFQSLVTEGRHALALGDAATGATKLGAALSLWRGDPLADLSTEPFAREPIERLNDARIAALESRIDADLALGDQQELVVELRSLVGRYPYHEPFRRQLMLALYRCGRQADALAAYSEARDLFVEELGIEPGPDLRRLQHAVLAHDPSLLSGPDASRPPAGRTRPRRSLRRASILAVAAAAAVPITVLATAAGGSSVDVHPDSVAVIDGRSGRVTSDIRLAAAPDAVATGGGFVWVANRALRLLIRIDATHRRVTDVIGVGAELDGLAAGTDGAWVTDSTHTAITHVDPTYGDAITTSHLAGSPFGSIADSPNAIWVADQEFPALLEINKATGRIVKQILLPIDSIPGGGGTSTIAVAGRSVWVGNFGGDMSRLEHDTSGFVVDATDPSARNHIARFGEAPSSLAVGAGELWITLADKDQVIAVDPTTEATTATIGVGHHPTSIAVGAGAIWVANGDGTVSQIDPLRNRVTRTIHLNHPVTAVAAGGRTIWVGVAAG
jgi:YVTN family beta-propeller protein